MANNEKRETSFSERIFNSHQKAKTEKNLQQLPKEKILYNSTRLGLATTTSTTSIITYSIATHF